MTVQIVGGVGDFSLVSVAGVLKDGAEQMWQGGESKDVSPAKNQNLGLDYQIENLKWAGLLTPTEAVIWASCVTVYNETDGQPVARSGFDQHDGPTGGAKRFAGIGKVTKPTTFRVKLWATMKDFPTEPPRSEW